MSVQKWIVKEPYLNLPCRLGEGPFYEEKSHSLRFIDIWDHKLHRIDLTTGPESLCTVDTGVALGVTADVEGSEDIIIAVGKEGFSKFDPKTGKHEYLTRIWNSEDPVDMVERMRMNDGAVDSKGRFWAGAMNDPKVVQELQTDGVLFRLDGDLKLHRVIKNATIPNGIGWNDKDDTMFWTDSPTRTIWTFDYDAETGNISNRRPFFELTDGSGVPDGFAMDVDGFIWSAVYYGSKVIRISPEGQLVGEISLPTRCITCPAFVGTELFITSAKEPDPEKFPESAKYGGNLFRVEVGIRGRPKHKFRIDAVA